MFANSSDATSTSNIDSQSSVKDVCEYLSTLSLSGFDFAKDVQNFETELIDGSCFLQLDKAEIMNLGIKKMSKRNALFKHIAGLNSKGSSEEDKLNQVSGVNQPRRIESAKAINANFEDVETVEHDRESFLQVGKNSRTRNMSKTQEFSPFDAEAPEFIPSQPVARTSIRRYSTATTLSPRNANNAIFRSSSKLSSNDNKTVSFLVANDENSIEVDQPKEIQINLSSTKKPLSEESSTVIECDLQDLGYEQASSSTNEFEVNLASAATRSLAADVFARTVEFSLETMDMEASEVMSLPPSVVLTDIVQPPQVGGDSQPNSVKNGELDRSEVTSIDFESSLVTDAASADAEEADVIEMALKMVRQASLTLPVPANDGQSMENSCETMEMTMQSQDLQSADIQLPQTTSAPYVMRLNVKKSKQHKSMAVVTFPAIFKDVTETNAVANQTKATFCLQNKTLQQLNMHYNKLQGRQAKMNSSSHSNSSWKVKKSFIKTQADNMLKFFDEAQCEHSFNIKNDQLSVAFSHVQGEFPKVFRNYYSVIGENNTDNEQAIIPSNTLVMVTYNFNNGCVLDFKPIPVRGTIKTLCDSNGLAWIESDLFVTGKMQHFGESTDINDIDAPAANFIYSVQSMKLEDQRRRTSLVNENGEMTKQRSVVLVNDESFDHQSFQSRGHYVEDAVSKVEFYLKLTTPCQQLYSESVLVEAWNVIQVIPSIKQQKKMERRLAMQNRAL